MKIPLDIPPGLVADDTAFAASGRWVDGSNVRFRLGRPQVIGGWEAVIAAPLFGVCRAALPWSDNAGRLNLAFGTHSHLQLYQGGALFDLTPSLAMPTAKLDVDPLAVTSGSAQVTVTHVAHGLATGDQITVSGALAVGGVTPNGTFAVTVIDADSYAFTYSSNASADATGGGSDVAVAPQVAFATGQVDGTGSIGYGTGGFGVGGYGEPATAEYFPRTWALAAWGEQLLANPRGGTIHVWTNDTATPAAPMANAPRQVTHMVVAAQDQVFALGCNEEVSGVFNPLCIRHSSIRNNMEWTTGAATTAREYVLPGGGRIVAGRVIGPHLLVWTTDALFLGSFVGSLSQPWRFDRVGRNCGLAGPNAAVVVGQAAFWVSPDRQFFRYGLGGSAEPIPCPIREDFADNLAASQADKIIASAISEYSEIRFDYPDARDGYENSRYVAMCIAGPDGGAWYRGVMARTAMVDAGPSLHPCGVALDGAIYWHERGASADGGVLGWRLVSGDAWLDEQRVVALCGLWPDFKQQAGPVNLDIATRLEPQSDQRAIPTVPLTEGQRKADLRATGRLVQVTLSGESSPAACRMGRLVFDVVQMGRR